MNKMIWMLIVVFCFVASDSAQASDIEKDLHQAILAGDAPENLSPEASRMILAKLIRLEAVEASTQPVSLVEKAPLVLSGGEIRISGMKNVKSQESAVLATKLLFYKYVCMLLFLCLSGTSLYIFIISRKLKSVKRELRELRGVPDPSIKRSDEPLEEWPEYLERKRLRENRPRDVMSASKSHEVKESEGEIYNFPKEANYNRLEKSPNSDDLRRSEDVWIAVMSDGRPMCWVLCTHKKIEGKEWFVSPFIGGTGQEIRRSTKKEMGSSLKGCICHPSFSLQKKHLINDGLIVYENKNAIEREVENGK